MVEAFSTPCECCDGRGFIVHQDPVERDHAGQPIPAKVKPAPEPVVDPEAEAKHEEVRSALTAIAAAAANAHSAPKETEVKPERNRRGFKERRKGSRNQLLDDAEALLDSIDSVLDGRVEAANEASVDSFVKASKETPKEVSKEPFAEVPVETPKRSGRRTAVMAAGQPTVQATAVEAAPVAIARPVAQVNVTEVLERPVKKSRRVAVANPVVSTETD